jgi:RNA polymerase sigma factor (sigma-70 family)
MIGEATLDLPLAARAETNRGAFLVLIGQYEPAMRRLASAYLDQTPDQEDLFQEIAVALWQALPGFRGGSSQRTWLYRIAHNVAISHSVKLRQRGKTEETISEPFDPPSAAIGAEHELLQGEKLRLLHEAIRELPPIDRQIVLLHLESLTYAEMQEITGLSESAIATRLTRSREKLKAKIRGTGGAQ